MADDEGYKLDLKSVRKIDKAIRQVLNTGARTGGSPGVASPQQAETCWAKLTSRVTDGFEWQEVYPFIGNDDKPDWATKADGRKGDNTANDPLLKNLAVELVKGTATTSSIVVVRRANQQQKQVGSAPPDWKQQWYIISPIPAVGRAQCTDAMGNGATCKAKVYDPFAGVVGDEFTVDVVRHTDVGNQFYAAFAGNGSDGKLRYVQLGLPPAKQRGMVLQMMDSSETLGCVDWDFTQVH